MATQMDIPLNGPSVDIVRQCRSALCDVLENKFGCVATINGVDFERDLTITQHKRPTVVPEKRFTGSLHAGPTVSVWKADLTNFTVDAVVNAANVRLQHQGGLALALSMAGGLVIDKDSDEYIKKHGPLKTGDAVICDAGSLPCKKIIHAVGPQVFNSFDRSELSAAEPLLKKAIKNILDRVKEHSLQNVAIPAISSGLFGYPLQQCAETIVSTVKDYYENCKGHHPKEVMFVNNDEPTVSEMERACRQKITTSKSKHDAKTSSPFVQIGNVCLTLKTGKIEEEQTDVIVNTASWNGDLNTGQISKAILEKAGRQMQKEFSLASVGGFVSVTKAYNLRCKEVYHTRCVEKERDQAQQILYQSVQQCLGMAANNNYNSIAFPAIGTGGLGFSKREVARIMSVAVFDFSQMCPKKLEVYFVIFPSDKETYKAFEVEVRTIQQHIYQSSFPHASMVESQVSSPPALENRGDFHKSRAPGPHISLSGPSDEATCEANRWLSDLLSRSSGPVCIWNNFIQSFGEQEHLQLSHGLRAGIYIEEVFERGRAGMILNGELIGDVVDAVLQVEAMLCKIQREFVKEEELAMHTISNKNVSFERLTVHQSSPEFKDKVTIFKCPQLWMMKVDKVENPALKIIFDLKKKQLGCSTTQAMFQRMPAQFCEMVCRTGFHTQYAPPDDPAHGEGIYFAGTVKTAMEMWKVENEECVHFVEALVLTGNSVPGKPGLILPPAMPNDPQSVYDSVTGRPDVSVIFSGYQALPMYIITCRVRSLYEG